MSVTGLNLSGISVCAELVAAKMVPYGYEMGGMVETVLVKNIDATGLYCHETEINRLRWYRGRFDCYPILSHTLIESCKLQGYEIVAVGTDTTVDGKLILFSIFTSQPGDINDEDGILQYNPSTIREHEQTQNQIVPGESAQLFAYLSPVSGTEIEKKWIGHAWWGPDYFSGGFVVTVNGEYGDPEITYSVDIMGKVRTVVPSDFIEYAVGDWVFATNLSAIGNGCEWDEDNETGISSGTDNGWIILPIKIADHGA